MENTSGEREFKTKIITLTNYYLNKKGAPGLELIG